MKGKAIMATAKKTKSTKKADSISTANFHPLSTLIPDPAKAVSYTERLVAPEISDLQVLEAAHRTHTNVLITGPTGAGKTSAVYAYAAKAGLPVVNIACSQALDVDTQIGSPSPNPDGTITLFRPGQLTNGVLHGAVIYFDEINMASPRVLALFHSLTDWRRTITIAEANGSGWCSSCGGYNDPQDKEAQQLANTLALRDGRLDDLHTVVCDHCGATFDSTNLKAHADVVIVASCNEGYEGTYPLNKALKNRFQHFLDVDYDADIESTLVSSPTLIELAVRLRELGKSGDLQTPVSTNKLIELELLASELSLDYALNNFLSYFAADERPPVREAIEHVYGSIVRDLYGDDAVPVDAAPVADSADDELY